MCVEVVWDDAEQSTIRMVFSRKWNWDEFYQAADRVDDLTRSVEHPVAYLVDMRQTRTFPSGISAARVRHALTFNYPNVALAIVVGTSLFVQTMTASLMSVVGQRENYLFLEDIDEARALIAERLKEVNAG